ncbi:MAG: HlyC/CorC family transporter [Microbacteriaceae bacterium]|nr:HlyC/CorC family transporter [Microbacteriaceae bacterium]
MPEWALFAIGVVLTIGTGFFVASEFSLVNLDRAELEARQGRGERGLGWTISALRRTSTHLSSAQLGITLTTLLAGFTLEPALSHWIAPALRSWGIAEGAVGPIASVVALLVATVLSMIFGELVPKNLALALPLPTARIVVPFQTSFTAVFRPVVWVLNATAGAILRLFGIEQKEELSSARTADELASLVRRSASEGSLEQDTATLLTRTLRFSERTAADVMTPRPRLETVDRDDSAEDVIELARRTGHSRFPVEDGSPDEIVGVVHVKQAVAVPRDRRRDVPVAAIATEAHRVPETMRLDTLLGQLRAEGYQMAIVVDEYGGTAGVATLEDLVEELVGEVSDEHDRRRTEIVRSRGGVVFPGMWRPDELLDRIGVAVPEDGPYETVGGWIMAELGRIPVAGDEVVADGGTFRVVRMDGRRVDRVRLTPAGPDTPPSAALDARGGGER